MKYCKIANNGVQPIMVDNAVTINNIKKVQIVTYHEILYKKKVFYAKREKMAFWGVYCTIVTPGYPRATTVRDL